MQQDINKAIKKFTAFTVLVLGFSVTQCVGAEPEQPTLKALLAPITTLQANFKQTVRSEKGKVLQSSVGKMYIKKPGQFRWEVAAKDPRLVVADGKQVFDYDKDLAQVTIQKLNVGRTRAPIFFLTGDSGALEQDFNVKSLSAEKKCLTDSDACFLLSPKKKDGSFQSIKIGFKAGNLKEMEMLDQLGQRSQFIFFDVVQNGPLDPKLFQFKPPKGVDVLHSH